jgi:ERCC4-type nuclease
MKIIIDTREQTPYDFSRYPVESFTGTLDTGDYSLAGFEDQVAVERKELSDIISCLGSGRERFTRELDRLRGYESAALVIESPLQVIRAGKYRSSMKPEAAEQSLISIMQRYRLPVYFAQDRSDGQRFTYNFLRHFFRHAERRYKAIQSQKAKDQPGSVDFITGNTGKHFREPETWKSGTIRQYPED